MIKFVTGNLLDARVDALVNTVNTKGVMGRALRFSSRKHSPRTSRHIKLQPRRAKSKLVACLSLRLEASSCHDTSLILQPRVTGEAFKVGRYPHWA